MKFKFKIQGYQTEAVANTIAMFTGQPNRDASSMTPTFSQLQATLSGDLIKYEKS